MFQLSEASDKIFHELKKRLTTTSVLTLPEITQDFVVNCDVSFVCLGYVQMKKFEGYNI